MGNKNRTQKKVEYRGSTFIGTLKGGKVAVRVQRTARGQALLAGIFDVQNRSWQNENHSAPLPSFVKNEIEENFA
ncbi:hypothetical protein IKF88_00295 [Candidatus Saccharibacteria bacterium]|nr:hypothetical protein [Candidatus Saccharibacteria bacterium]